MAEAAIKVPQGMNDTQRQDYLAQAERHIAMVEDRIAWQKRIIDRLAQARQETDCALSMLHALENVLACLRAASRDDFRAVQDVIDRRHG